MAKAKRERRNSIRTMPADRALEALEQLERAEPPAAARADDPPADDGPPGNRPEAERE